MLSGHDVWSAQAERRPKQQDQSNARQSFKHRKLEPMAVLRCAVPSTSHVPSVAIWCMRIHFKTACHRDRMHRSLACDVVGGVGSPLFDQCVRCLFGRAALVGFFCEPDAMCTKHCLPTLQVPGDVPSLRTTLAIPKRSSLRSHLV